MKAICDYCGTESNYCKIGWTNAPYCSEHCERSAVSDLHGNMPGAGPVPRRNWVPAHIGSEIARRWSDEKG